MSEVDFLLSYFEFNRNKLVDFFKNENAWPSDGKKTFYLILGAKYFGRIPEHILERFNALGRNLIRKIASQRFNQINNESYENLILTPFQQVLNNAQAKQEFIERNIHQNAFWLLNSYHKPMVKALQDLTMELESERGSFGSKPLVMSVVLLGKSKKSNPFTAPEIASFCLILNDAGILKKEAEETVASFCKRACDQYNLTYSDRVRQNFSNRLIKASEVKVRMKIVPTLEPEIQDKLLKYLDTKKQ